MCLGVNMNIFDQIVGLHIVNLYIVNLHIVNL